MSNFPCIIVHGGVEKSAKRSLLVERVASCRKSVCIGYQKLINGANAIEAVEASLRWLEDDELFNCGYGSVLNRIGQVQMDSSIMDGATVECGSVVAVSKIDHPISLAKHVMEKWPNAILSGEAGKRFADDIDDVAIVSESNLVSPAAHALHAGSAPDAFNGIAEGDRAEAAGCVAWDGRRMAAGATTGGLELELAGRLGHSGLLGCGVYAEGRFGCSLAGGGERAIALGLARHLGLGPQLDLGRLAGGGSGLAGVTLRADGSWTTFGLAPVRSMAFAYLGRAGLTSGADLQHSGAWQ